MGCNRFYLLWNTKTKFNKILFRTPKLRTTVSRYQPSWWASSTRLMAPAEALREARSTSQSQKTKTEAVKDLEAWSLNFPLNSNWSPKCSSRTKASVEARRVNRSPKWTSKPEVLVEIGIFKLDFDAMFDCKCQKHNSTSKKLSKRSYFMSKIEYSCWIFRLSWFQLTGPWEKSVD